MDSNTYSPTYFSRHVQRSNSYLNDKNAVIELSSDVGPGPETNELLTC